MSERLFTNSGCENLSVTHDEAWSDAELRQRYIEERVAKAKAGESVWMLRGFEMGSEDEGYALDYYHGGVRQGFIEGNDLDGYQVYGPAIEEGGGPHHLNTEPIELRSEAQKVLKEYIEQTTIS